MLKAACKAVAASMLCLAGTGLWPSPGEAACLPTPTEPGTNCAEFLPDSSSDVVNIYWQYNLALNRFFQLSLFTSALNPVVIDQLQWSQDGTSWTSFQPNTIQTDNSGFLAYTNIVGLSNPIGNPLHVRYTIPAEPLNPVGTFAQDDVVSTQLISNRNGYNTPMWDSNREMTVPVLTRMAGNGYVLDQRDHVDAPDSVPGPLPLLGAAGALSFSRHLRRRLRIAS